MHLSTIQQGVLQGRPLPVHLPRTPLHPESFTPIPLTLDPRLVADVRAGPVSSKLYSGFIEHLGRCIYGGLLDDPRDPSSSSLLEPQDVSSSDPNQPHTKGRLGWRSDVRKILKSDGELAIPLMRWPGGNFVSNYHWQDGVGPIADRPPTVELAWLGDPETNAFGTDEFIEMCKANGWEPYICLNMGSGTLEEALAWVEYCNGTGETKWAKMRRRNTGRDEAYGVKYWGLGNEMWGPWQVGNLSATEYAAMARRWAHALKLVDPSITLVSCGETGWSDWDREVLAAVTPFVDLHSIHWYSMLGHQGAGLDVAPSADSSAIAPSGSGHDYEKNVFGPAAAERAITLAARLIDLANIDLTMRGIPARDVKLAFDEWNVWDTVKAPAERGLEQAYDYTDMLGVVAWLNVLVRQHKDVAVACLAQSVNVIAPLMARPDGVLRQTTFWPLSFFARYMKDGHVLALPSMPDVYDGPTYPTFIQQLGLKPAYIDMVAIVGDVIPSSNGHGSSDETSGSGHGGASSIRISILNRHPSLDWTFAPSFAGFTPTSVTVTEVYCDDLSAVNTFDEPDRVTPETKTFSAKNWTECVVRKHSWAFVVVEGVRE